MNKDITAAVRTLAFRDAEQTLTADEFAKLDEKYKNDIQKWLCNISMIKNCNL